MIGKIHLAELARKAVPSLSTADALAIAQAQESAVRKELSHELRWNRFQRRQLGRQLGKAGATIHALRGEVALLRENQRNGLTSVLRNLLSLDDGEQVDILEMVPLNGQSQTDGHQNGSEVVDLDKSEELGAAAGAGAFDQEGPLG